MLWGMLLRRSPVGFGPLSTVSQETRKRTERASAARVQRCENFMDFTGSDWGRLGIFEDHFVAGLDLDAAHEGVVDDIGNRHRVF